MTKLKVVVPLLNKRKFPVIDTTDKGNVAGQVKMGFQFESKTQVTNALGIWYQDQDNYYYWGGGVEEMHTTKPLPWWITDFGIDEVWKYSKGEGVTVVTLDTGLFTNDDYKPINNFERKSIFSEIDVSDEDGHGTLMASIIAGNGNDIYGIAPDVELISIKIFSKSGSLSTNGRNWDNLKNGLKLFTTFDKSKTYVINCSCAGTTDEATKKQIQELVDEINKTFQVVFVCAVGNDSLYRDPFIVPARLENVISVAGHNKIGYTRLSSSNYWRGINLTCPAEYKDDNLINLFPDLEFFGSSHACAYASGLISLFLSKFKPKDNFYREVCKWLDKITVEKILEDEDINITLIYKQLNSNKLISTLNNSKL